MYDTLYGHTDPVTHQHVEGLVDSTARVAQSLKTDYRVNVWIVRGLGLFLVARFFGIDHLSDILKVFGVK